MGRASEFSSSIATIVDLVKKGLTIEAQEAIAQLRSKVVDLAGENADLRHELNELRQQIRDLEATHKLEAELKFDGTVYRRTSDDENARGPFCQVCYDEHKRLSRVTFVRHPATGDKWFCHVCKNNFHLPGQESAPIPAMRPR
ncbi:MAG: hypothetical protein ACREHG_08300 [Candidatus Saccharimonadales bacterium]